jgi:hypothetical protein
LSESLRYLGSSFELRDTTCYLGLTHQGEFGFNKPIARRSSSACAEVEAFATVIQTGPARQ